MKCLTDIITAAEMIKKRDPAAHSLLEIFMTYSGFHALAYYRAAHWFYRHNFYLLAALISHSGKMTTGIEIHPGAKIGKFLFIDHGNGVVIGQTAVIGDNVTIMHNVTLGSRKQMNNRRHPIVGNNVFIGAGAQLLGPITIGAKAKIGAGTIVLIDVPEGATIVGNPGHLVTRKK